MKKATLKTLLFSCVLASASTAMADHMSPWGEGWASMPNDIHNTRLDTDDNDEFIDFVREGGGADSVNRFLDEDDASTGSGGGQGGRP